MKELYQIKCLTRTSTALHYIAAKNKEDALKIAKNNFPYCIVSIYEHLGTIYIK